jgi:hypothetical protein
MVTVELDGGESVSLPDDIARAIFVESAGDSPDNGEVADA